MGSSTQSIKKAGWVLYRGGKVTTVNRNASLGRIAKNVRLSCGRGKVLIDSYPQRAMNLLFRNNKSGYICIDKKDVHPIRPGLNIIYSKYTHPIIVSGRKRGFIVSGVCRKQTLFPTPGAKVTVVAVNNVPVSAPPAASKSRGARKSTVSPAAKQMGIDKVLVPIRLSGTYYVLRKFDCAPLMQLDIPPPKRATRKP